MEELLAPMEKKNGRDHFSSGLSTIKRPPHPKKRSQISTLSLVILSLDELLNHSGISKKCETTICRRCTTSLSRKSQGLPETILFDNEGCRPFGLVKRQRSFSLWQIKYLGAIRLALI